MSAIRHVIWDFNGTLLDDVSCCVDTLNTLLSERKLPAMTVERYREQFGFPVRDFYVELGFDFAREDFGQISTTFIARYLERAVHAAPYAGAHDAMERVAERAMQQSVLSAMERETLTKLLAHYELDSRLQHVRGLPDLSAHSKVELGCSLVAELDVAPSSIVLVGDTLHDHEVAQAMGCACILVAHGHQSRPRIERALAQRVAPQHQSAKYESAKHESTKVVDSLGEVLSVLAGRGGRPRSAA